MTREHDDLGPMNPPPSSWIRGMPPAGLAARMGKVPAGHPDASGQAGSPPSGDSWFRKAPPHRRQRRLRRDRVAGQSSDRCTD